MKNYINLTLIGMFFLLSGFSYWAFLRKPEIAQVVDQNKDIHPQNQEKDNAKILFFDNYISLIIKNDGARIDPKILLTDTLNKNNTLNGLTHSQDKIIFRFSYQDCSDCINSVIKVLNKLNPGKAKNKIVMITDSYSIKDFLLKAKDYNSKFPIFSLVDKNMGLSLENKNIPFIFVLTKDNKAIKFFLPFKDQPEKTEEYLNVCLDGLNLSNN